MRWELEGEAAHLDLQVESWALLEAETSKLRTIRGAGVSHIKEQRWGNV